MIVQILERKGYVVLRIKGKNAVVGDMALLRRHLEMLTISSATVQRRLST